MIKFKINTDSYKEFKHYWEMCVRSCHAYTALREDYRKQLKVAHDELGFKYVRFHGLFNDDMCVCVMKKDFMGNELGIVYNFVNIDNIFDFLLSIGMKPFIELGFMPSCLASGDKTSFHYKGNITPPADYNQWKNFIKLFTEHLVQRYGIDEVKQWFFEVWNEPNLPFFFDGTKEDYFKLYKVTVDAIKEVDSELKVGGPATSINAWIPDMINYCEINNVPLDFITTHHYPSDDPLWRSGMDIEEFFKSDKAKTLTYERGVLKKMATKARNEAGKYPLYYTEWNTSAMVNDDSHDTCYASAMIAKILADNDGIVDGYSYWTFTDIFEEHSQLAGFFHGGFGLQTYSGIKKPAYRLFELYHKLGNKRCEVESSDPNSTVELIATKSEKGLKIIAYNHNVPDELIAEEQFTIELSKSINIKEIKVQRIDDKNINPRKVWIDMGAPEYPNKEQIDVITKESELQLEYADELKFSIPEHGVIFIDITLK